MAQPKKEPRAASSQVASCAATDCRHNDSRSCTADSVQIQMKGGSPVCGTYASEKPKARP